MEQQQRIPRSKPQDYGLHHTEFRPGQQEAIEFCLDSLKPEPPHGVVILEAPTGSGKTPIVKGVAADHQVIALTRTKSLQAENYGGGYRFDVLFGRSNYNCVHPEARAYATAEDCLHADKMNECPVAADCQYLIKKHRAQGSQHAALNYSYWLTSRWPRESTATVLACDEAHLLSETVLDFAGITITEAQRREFDLAHFPSISSGAKRIAMSGNDPLAAFFKTIAQPHDVIIDWLSTAQPIVTATVNRLKKAGDPRLLKRAQSLQRKIESTIGALGASHDDWYIRSGSGVRYTPNGNEPGLICRPLTARYHFPRYFVNRDKRGLIAMSATIGDVATFAEELGIEEYSFLQMPNQWAPNVRPIMALAGSPALGQAAKRDGGEAYEQQARIVAKAINEVPREWSGVLHVTAKVEAQLVAERLTRAGLGDRLWVPSIMDGTDRQLAQWAIEKQRIKTVHKAGALAITWSWSTGVNLTEERICGVLKTPYPFLGDPYERERQMYDGKFYLQRTAWELTQALGRTRRGEAEDYDLNGKREQLVFIADKNWKRVRKYIPTDVREAIVED